MIKERSRRTESIRLIIILLYYNIVSLKGNATISYTRIFNRFKGDLRALFTCVRIFIEPKTIKQFDIMMLLNETE